MVLLSIDDDEREIAMETAHHGCIFAQSTMARCTQKLLRKTKTVLAFEDINKAAPFHVLVIPRVHVASLNELPEKHAPILGEMAMMAQHIARENQFESEGFRFVINTERGAGQSVFHLHAHVLAGRDFSWPPG
jgi:histidine triad (HIT) family protein